MEIKNNYKGGYSFKERELTTPDKVKVWDCTNKQKLAILEVMNNPSITKGQALRNAGYSEAVINAPQQVFGSPAVMKIMEELGLTPKKAIDRVKKRLDYRTYRTIDIPLHKDEVEIDPKTGDYKKETSDLTDGDILEIFTDVDIKVMKIEHRNNTRVVWLSMKNIGTESESLNQLIKIFGLEAPRKLDVKEDVTHHFSLSGIRRVQEDKGIEPFKTKVYDVPAE